MKDFITFVGLDVHKNSIDVALADGGREGEVRYYGSIGGDRESLDRLIRKLVSTGSELHFVYEAGPCGYDIYRYLQAKGFDCAVVAPSGTPKKGNQRVKNDHRDAITLARLHRARELTYVFVPREDDEAMRDLVRARQDAVKAQRVARQQLGGMLLRLGFRYSGKRHWTQQYFRWLSKIKMPTPPQQVVYQEYIHAIKETTDRVERLTRQIEELVPTWRMVPVIRAYQALRGVSLIIATTMVAELGDITRFTNPRQLMAFLGLIPSEHSSGEKTRKGGITKTGNGHARRMLVEAAHTYGYPARVSRRLLLRQEGLGQTIRDIAWKCQVRLCGRFRRLVARGKNHNNAVTAIARELAAFMWAIAKEVPVSG
jgi:transposase